MNRLGVLALALCGVVLLLSGVASLAQPTEPPVVQVPAYPGWGPVIDWTKLFAGMQAAAGFVALALRFAPHSWVQNTLVPRFMYVLFVIGNVAFGLTEFGKSSGIVQAAGSADVVHLAGWGALSWAALLKSAMLAVLQTYIGRRAWEEVGKEILPASVLRIGKPPA